MAMSVHSSLSWSPRASSVSVRCRTDPQERASHQRAHRPYDAAQTYPRQAAKLVLAMQLSDLRGTP